jgi:leucyl-tRNA synthetase
MQRYNPNDIESKWQQKWAADKIYEAKDDSGKPKKYVLEFFPYPSGAAMHVGHVRNYVIGDALARHARMNGFEVLHPMGWDAFGLPAENYAIKTGISPKQAIAENTTRFKEQLTKMGFGFDWSRAPTRTIIVGRNGFLNCSSNEVWRIKKKVCSGGARSIKPF